MKDAIQRSREVLQIVPTNDPMAGLKEFLSKEPVDIQAEFSEYCSRMQKVNSPFRETPSLPELSQDLKDAIARIQERLKGEPFLNGDVFDVDRYAARVRELFQDEQPQIQSELAKLKPRLQEIADRPVRAARQRNRTLKQIRTLLRDEPVIAYIAGIEWEGMSSIANNTIVVAPTTDPFDILRYERTDGANHGLQTEDIIEKLKIVDRQYGVDIVGACMDGIEFILQRVPKRADAEKLGKWLLDFCPDLSEAPRSFPKGKVSLWWD